ncbi:cytochrome P450 [Pseudonocardia spinosispora]|uniref:cytochrome P450 n=1 Tax=Pseudonocardia spinosispora TaxID=103441 RepID=UPI0004236036|nr:cytochrome P450 [Pseudonocardia spinosispora]
MTAPLHDPSTYLQGPPLVELARLRREQGVVRVPEPDGPGYWLVLRHDDVEQVLKQPATFSSAMRGTQVRDPETNTDLRYVQRMMLNMDPPEHSRIRRLVAKSFTPRAVAALTDRIEGHARALVDAMLGDADQGECDFAKDVAADLPLLTLAEVLGVPAQDRGLLFDWSNRVIGWQDEDYATSSAFDAERGTDMAREALRLRPLPDSSGAMPDPRAREGMPDLYAYAHLLAENKRANPGNDIMSILLAQPDETISVEEFENLFWLFAVAGNETLRNGIPGGMHALLTHPDQQRALRADPSLLEPAVEEMLRWWTPVMVFRRTATSPVTLSGVDIAADEKVVVSFLSANRDESVFTDPDRFDVRREPGKHLVFGHGPHFCLGAMVARTQMRALFRELFARTSWLEPAGEPAFLRSNFQRGVKRLPVRWRR